MAEAPPRPHFTFATSLSSAPPRSDLPVVIPGEPIPAEPGCLRGHGTLAREDGLLAASVSGVVERVNKLVSVRPLRSRYTGEVGDVVVCRVVDVGQKRWKVDVTGRQNAVLMLSSINLPGGVQRRRTAQDQLNMRQFYVEHDLLSAEVQAFFQDGSMSVHTRSLKYGKLQGGMLVQVVPSLMKRLKQHFFRFAFGVSAIFGMNGNVWVAPTPAGALDSDELNDVSAQHEGERGHAAPPAPPSVEVRERVCRVRNALVALDSLYIAVSPASVLEVYNASIAANLSAREMLLPHVMVQITKGSIACHGGASAAKIAEDNATLRMAMEE
mmetsp:Transcript_13443/g.29084  ORF Transcript_13443/g.29084 Transcript_13443/m.29084 type:complete len:326 (-) Transcript_13443:186-1163(-)|eukprot:CAMPEP_0183360032 /NCGR_PEP_ID=MMETSP0164_2-20130417/54076_1 /TAXON_ID=221442 /ORGANISM="Coccolithus pelagicus ssp braarudi, Strain PLY182g" /LENGTH=325 /DNA_ID=CAMNT_0025534285 /DNA_START=12 /DNA_END=989 /DNA_ORIENTATION=+